MCNMMTLILTKLSFSFKRLDILFTEVIEFPGECSGSSESESTIGDLKGITDFFLADRRGTLKYPMRYIENYFMNYVFTVVVTTYFVSSTSVLYSDSSASLNVSSVSPVLSDITCN